MARYGKYTLPPILIGTDTPGTTIIITAYGMSHAISIGRFSLFYRRDEPKMIKAQKEVGHGAGTKVLIDLHFLNAS